VIVARAVSKKYYPLVSGWSFFFVPGLPLIFQALLLGYLVCLIKKPGNILFLCVIVGENTNNWEGKEKTLIIGWGVCCFWMG